MIQLPVSVNQKALKIVLEMIEEKEDLAVSVERAGNGATLIDAGIGVRGGYEAGRLITEICMGGLGSASIGQASYDERVIEHPGVSLPKAGSFLSLTLPTIFVATDFPSVALFGAQFAGWRVSLGQYFAMGSGPARALSLKPKEMYAKIEYQDSSDSAVIILETTQKPPVEVLDLIAKECKVSPDKLYAILVPTSCLAGSTQISGRIVETGLHKLSEVGFDPKRVLYGSGYAPIAPIHPKFTKAMGRTNDMLLYGGATFFTVEYDDDEALRKVVEAVPSAGSKDYGKPFADVFKAAGYDFYKVDPALFAPASIVVNNQKTGSTFAAGRINPEVIKQSIST